jgi:CHAT domain-containing protein
MDIKPTLTWMGIAAGILSAILAALLIASHAHRPSTLAETPLDIALRMPRRPIEARIAGWPYRPFARSHPTRVTEKPVSRGPGSSSLPASTNDATPARFHQSGLENLLTGRNDAAVDQLGRAAQGEPGNAQYWSDLAAGFIARAQHDDNPSELADALATADRALRIDANLPAASFNRGLALQLLNLDAAAARQFRVMRTNEASGSGWSSEATDRIVKLQHERRDQAWSRNRQELALASKVGDTAAIDKIVSGFRQEARTSAEVQVMNEWAVAILRKDDASAASALTLARHVADSLLRLGGDGLLRDAVGTLDELRGDSERTRHLAYGYRAYYDARVAYAKRDVLRSIPLFESAIAIFATAQSPMQRVASYYLASAHFDSNNTTAAERALLTLAAKVPPHHRALKAQIAWELCTINGNRGSPYEELQFCEESLRGFEELEEFDNAASMSASVAAILGRLGRDSDAWKLRRRSFASASESGDPARLQFALAGAAHETLATQRWDVARSLFTIAAETPNPNSRLRFDTFLGRAIATWRSADDATSDLDAALAAIAEIRDEALHAAALADLALTRGTILARSNPPSALEHLNKYLEFIQARGKTLDLPLALFQRARARRAAQDEGAALTDLQHAIGLLEQRRATIVDGEVRDSFLGTYDELFEDFVDMLDQRGDLPAAFEAAERNRARMLVERLAGAGQRTVRKPLGLSEIRAHLPQQTLLIEYISLPDRVLAFALTHDGIRLLREQVSRDDLRALRQDLVAALRRDDSATAKRIAAALYRTLLEPLEPELSAATQIAIVGDETTGMIPFASLYDNHRAQYLIERIPLVYALSATSFVYGTSEPFTTPPSSFRALIVGDPLIPADSNSILGELPPLPAARAEAQEIAMVYGTSAIVGRAATLTRVLKDAPNCDVLHFATHARACRYDPSQSALEMASEDGTTNPLSVQRIATLKLARRPIVVLAGCRTAMPADRGGTLRSLAAAFIAAGSRNVVGTLWDVDDDMSRDLAVRFHRELLHGATPSSALRTAQLHLLHNAPNRFLSTWSAFQIAGISSTEQTGKD